MDAASLLFGMIVGGSYVLVWALLYIDGKTFDARMAGMKEAYDHMRDNMRETWGQEES